MFMAPEFFASENPTYDKSVDIFATGMLFLAMLKAEAGKALVSPTTGTNNNNCCRIEICHKCIKKKCPWFSINSEYFRGF